MKNKEQGEIVIEKLAVGVASVWIKGTSPMIYNAMSAKAWHELLLPKGRKTAADRATMLKHDPEQEYRDSVYRSESDEAETRLVFPATAFKNAAIGAIRHMPNSGVTMVQMKQLLWVNGDMVNVYGVPKLLMSIVRSADMNKTPDVRTRAILPEWCCCLSVNFVMPNLNETNLARLFEAGGLLNGIGDFRQEKGKGNYGQFRLANKSECESIIEAGGREAQDLALAEPECYDVESQELLMWYRSERTRRGR